MRQGLFREQRIRGRRLQRIRERHLQEHPLCARCEAKGRVTEAVEVDHIIPLGRGGKERDDNRQSLCVPCHIEKTAEDMNYRIKHGGDVNGNSLDPESEWSK